MATVVSRQTLIDAEGDPTSGGAGTAPPTSRTAWSKRRLSPPAGVHDAEDDNPVRLPAVLDDVMPEVLVADIRTSALGGMVDVKENSSRIKSVIENLVIDVSLVWSPGREGVLENARPLATRP